MDISAERQAALKRATEIKAVPGSKSKRELVQRLIAEGKLTSDDLYDRTKKKGCTHGVNVLIGNILRAEGYTDIPACYLNPKPSSLGKRLAEEPSSQLALEKIKKLTTSKGEVLPLGCVFDPIGAADARARDPQAAKLTRLSDYPCFDVKWHRDSIEGTLQVLEDERAAHQHVMRHQAAEEFREHAGKNFGQSRTAVNKWQNMRNEYFGGNLAMSRGQKDLADYASYLSTSEAFSATSTAAEVFPTYMNYVERVGKIQGWLDQEYAWKKDMLSGTESGHSIQLAQDTLTKLALFKSRSNSTSKGSLAPTRYQLDPKEFRRVAAAARAIEDPCKGLATLILLAMLKICLQRGKTIASLQWQQLSIAPAVQTNWGRPVRLANAQSGQMKNSTKGNDHKDYIGRQLSIKEPCLFFLLALSLVLTEDYLTKPPFRSTQKGSFFDSIIQGVIHPAEKRPHPTFPDFTQDCDAYPAFQNYMWVSKHANEGRDLLPISDDDIKRYLRKAFDDAGIKDKQGLSYTARYFGFAVALQQQASVQSMVQTTGHKAKAASTTQAVYAQNIPVENMVLITTGHYETSDAGLGWRSHGVMGRQLLDEKYIEENWGAGMVTLLRSRLLPKLADLKQAVQGRQEPMWKAAHNLVPVFGSMWLAFLQDSAYWKDKWPTVYSCLSMFEDPQIQAWWPEWRAKILDVDHMAQQVYHVIANTQDRSDLLRDAMTACKFGRHVGREAESCAESLQLLECAYRMHYAPSPSLAPVPLPAAPAPAEPAAPTMTARETDQPKMRFDKPHNEKHLWMEYTKVQGTRSLQDMYEFTRGSKDKGGRKGFCWEPEKAGDRFRTYKYIAFALADMAKVKQRGTKRLDQMETVFKQHETHRGCLDLTMAQAAGCWKAVLCDGSEFVQVGKTSMPAAAFRKKFGLPATV